MGKMYNPDFNSPEFEGIKNRVTEIQEFLKSQDTPLIKFDEEVFRRLIEKVIVYSMVEVKEILG